MNYALLGLLAVVLLTGLVAFGVGHKRWSWGTLIAAFLVLVAAAGYLYVASRFAAYEWSWASFVRAKQVQLAKVRDALVPDAAKGGRLKPLGGGDDDLSTKPIAELVKERERWQRALDRIDTWHGRSWGKASFEPPKKDGETGKLEIPFGAVAPPAVEGEAAPAEAPKPGPPPLDQGSTVYLFEDVPAQEGGRYLGAFLVQTAEVDGPAGRYVLTVAQTEPRDAYDAQVWSRSYDAVTVYETLPSDRWQAFSKTAAPTGDSPLAPEPQRLSLEQVEGLLEERDRQRTFLEEFEKHETVADKAEWDRIRQRLDEGVEQPGSYWAIVKFTQTAAIATGIEDEAAARSFEPGETAECDLQTAFALAAADKATIEEVRYRRRLQDAGTFIHGARIFRGSGPDAVKESIAADGVAGLVAVLRREIRSLDDSTTRLAESRTAVEAELKATEDRRQRLAADKTLWDRDATAAEQTAGAFAAEVARARQLLAATEASIVAQADELRAAVGRLVERIDAVAPAPVRPAPTP